MLEVTNAMDHYSMLVAKLKRLIEPTRRAAMPKREQRKRATERGRRQQRTNDAIADKNAPVQSG